LIGSDGGEEPWRYCVTDTNNVIGFAIGAMFVREVFHGDSKPEAEAMINDVRTAFKKNLKNLKWMDKETRRLAEEKADSISDMIGFPDYILNPIELDKKYKDLDIDEKKYFDNNIRINMYNLKKNLEKLDQVVNKTRWGMTPPTVNAYYTPTKNQIVFPAGILQLPFYDINNPKSLNFGAMGVVMGHELTHAFDDQGREYDKNGNLHQWWNNKTIDKFKQRTDCFTRQYSNYSINGKSLNGKQTLGKRLTFVAVHKLFI
jgi:neprilysin